MSLDPITTGIATAGTLQLAKQGQDFIAAISGHPGESVGTMLGNIGRRRIQNVESVAAKSNFTLLNIGVKAGEVPLSILYPLLEGASLHDEASPLQETWANLLANAADPRSMDNVLPAFPSMLKELTPSDAVFINSLYEDVKQRFPQEHKVPADIQYSIFDLRKLYDFAVLKIPQKPPEPGKIVGIAVDNRFLTSIEILARQGILTRRNELKVQTSFPAGSIPMDMDTNWSLSYLGWSFIVACQPPPLGATQEHK